MLRIVDCLTIEHDPALTVLATVICVLGVGSSVLVTNRALVSERSFGWIAASGLCLGSTAWSTHFIAMLAYRTALPMTYDPWLTVLSLAVGIAIVCIGLFVGRFGRRRRAYRLLCGALLGSGVIGLHYIGMDGLRFPGTLRYDADLVIASIIASLLFGMLAAEMLLGARHLLSRIVAGAALTAMIVSLHFTAMGAARLELDVLLGTDAGGVSRAALVVGVAIASFAVVAAGIAAALIDRRLVAHLSALALRDPLTDLPNRRALGELADRAIEHAARGEGSLALMVVDLDDFKSVNDLHGHAAGDELIRVVARRVSALLGEDDIVARLGGDEFALLLGPATRPERARALTEALHRALSTPVDLGDTRWGMTASIGVAFYPDDGESLADLLRNADTAMYRAKADGKGVSRFFEPQMNEALRARRRLESRLREAVRLGTLDVAYQPLVSGSDRVPRAFEALLRWHDAELGIVSPAEFIPVAEASGLIVPIGEFVLNRACTDASGWADGISVAVNLSVAQFAQDGLVETVRGALERSGLAGERLEIEITESLLIENRDAAVRVLAELHALGVRIAMDDFGTGYSSLSYLQSFAFDKIKIDRSFVASMEERVQNAAIVHAVVAMGKSLGMEVVAEGVETEAQAAMLSALDCDQMQGYLFSKAIPAQEVGAFLERCSDPPLAWRRSA